MNNKATIELQHKTEKWLRATPKQIENLLNSNAEELRDVLRFHEGNYYIKNSPLISDAEYDRLYKYLEKYEAQNPDKITFDSPTQRVGGGLNSEFPKVSHLVPMLSLQNSYNEQDLKDWDHRIKETLNQTEIEYCIEPKFDGASISLIYENDRLIRGSTRGDGETGDDITNNIRRIKSIPLSGKFSQYGIEQIELRGEVLMNKINFENFNKQQSEAGLALLANPRNASAGTLRMKDPEEVSKRKLEAFVYHASYINLFSSVKEASELKTHSGILQMLNDLGFKSPVHESKVLRGIENVIKHISDFEIQRDDLPYEIDGMVIKVNKIDEQEILGMTSHHPRWAIAYKFKARQATSKLLSVSYQVGRTGAVTPVAKIEPVQVGGVTVSSISIHNEDYIREKDLRIGDSILIERSGDVIPQIVKSNPEVRTGAEKPIIYLTNCPACGDKLIKPEGEAVWRCVNISCPAQVVEKIIHFVSKDAMDIKNFGEANVRKFFELGLLKDIPGIYKLDFTSISSLEGIGEKTINNLKSAIEVSKKQPLHRLIYALGIRYVGETTAKTLARSVTGLKNLAEKSQEELMLVDDVGIKVAESIYTFFQNRDNIELIKELEQLGVETEYKVQEVKNRNLSGKTFLFTGTLNMKRSDAEEMVGNLGGTILNSVSSKLNYLVVGESAGSKLEKAKKIPSVNIITEDEFLKLIFFNN